MKNRAAEGRVVLLCDRDITSSTFTLFVIVQVLHCNKLLYIYWGGMVFVSC